MKSKIINIFVFIILVCSFCICNISYATQTGLVYIECNKENLEKNDEIEVSINLKDAKTAAFNFSLYFDNTKFEFISEAENVSVQENRIIYVWYDINGGKTPKDGEIAKFRFKAKEEGIANFSIEGEFYSETGQLIQVDFKEKQVQIKEKNGISEEQKEEKEKGRTGVRPLLLAAGPVLRHGAAGGPVHLLRPDHRRVRHVHGTDAARGRYAAAAMRGL